MAAGWWRRLASWAQSTNVPRPDRNDFPRPAHSERSTIMAREVDDIVLSSTLWSELRSHLLTTNDKPGSRGGNEQMAFILAATHVSASRIRLVGHELLRAQPTDLDHQ